MTNLLDTVKPTLLMGPGPSSVFDEVYAALGKPTIGHLDPRLFPIMDEIQEGLRTVMGTKNTATLPLSGTGSAGMETCFVNLVEPGDKTLILVNGVFSKRMVEVASRLGAEVDVLDFEWGTPVVVEKVAEQLKKKSYAIVAMVHAETSTGVVNPVKAVGDLAKAAGAYFIVDCVTSLGGMPVAMDEWNADALYSCSQKCLSTPPGLSPASFSQRAMDKVQKRKNKVPNWYFDMSVLMTYWDAKTRAYHHTVPVNMFYGIYAGLRQVLGEGLDKVYARHREMHEKLVSGLEAMGLSMYVDKSCRLPMLNAVTIPAGADDAKVRSRLLKEHDIEIGAGLGPMAGKIWRIGLMGHTARPANIDRLLAALKACI